MLSHEKEKKKKERGKGKKLTIKVLCLQGSSGGNFRNFLPAFYSIYPAALPRGG